MSQPKFMTPAMRVHTFCFGGAGAALKELPHVDGYFLVEGARA